MKRYIWAFIAFNVYSIVLLSAFQENTVYFFEKNILVEAGGGRFYINPREWDWGGHYVWRLFSGTVVTAFAGFLTGAVAKQNGSLVAMMSNIPSILIWGLMIYLLGFTDTEIESKTGFIVISIIAMPLTTYVAYLSGGKGEEIQEYRFPENTVLGIKAVHWIWAVIPLYFYSMGIVFTGARFLVAFSYTFGATDIASGLLTFAMLIPIMAWIYPLRIVNSMLNRTVSYGTIRRGLEIVGILVAGIIIATVIQFLMYWLLSKILS